VPRHQVVVQAPRMGGGFGGKETQGNTPAALVALAAVKTGRPVRVQLGPRPGHDADGQAAPVSRAFRGGV
jgi:xanthine dehydrogenase large subunit